ncbi:hypothetical protein F4680DRAFT_401129, partial [Xylaria scruposa]
MGRGGWVWACTQLLARARSLGADRMLITCGLRSPNLSLTRTVGASRLICESVGADGLEEEKKHENGMARSRIWPM